MTLDTPHSHLNAGSFSQEAFKESLNTEITKLYQQQALPQGSVLKSAQVNLGTIHLKSSLQNSSPQALAKTIAPLIFEQLIKQVSQER